jgi:hypothetical protein
MLCSVAKHQPITVGGVEDRSTSDVDEHCGAYDQ